MTDKDSINDLPKHNLKALIDVARMVEETQYGNITFTVRIHNGFITDVVRQQFSRKRYQLKNET